MKNLIIAAFAATLFASAISAPAAASEILTLNAPLAGASLNSEEIAMSVYFTETVGGAFEVVVTYLDAGQDQPQRIVMALSDGDNLRFGLPGYAGTLYQFARSGDSVTVSDAPAHSAPSASPEM